MAEVKVKEVEKEFLHHVPSGDRISPDMVVEVAKSMNARIGAAGLASREILMSCSIVNNKYLDLTGWDLAADKHKSRQLLAQRQTEHKQRRGAKTDTQAGVKVG